MYVFAVSPEWAFAAMYIYSVSYFSVARLAFCGQTGQMIFEFPLTAFMPLEQGVNFKAAVSLYCMIAVTFENKLRS